MCDNLYCVPYGVGRRQKIFQGR